MIDDLRSLIVFKMLHCIFITTYNNIYFLILIYSGNRNRHVLHQGRHQFPSNSVFFFIIMIIYLFFLCMHLFTLPVLNHSIIQTNQISCHILFSIISGGKMFLKCCVSVCLANALKTWIKMAFPSIPKVSRSVHLEE